MRIMDLDGLKTINDTHGHQFGAYTQPLSSWNYAQTQYQHWRVLIPTRRRRRKALYRAKQNGRNCVAV